MQRILGIIAALLALTVVARAEAAPPFAVTVEGKGPDVILIPGLASSQHVWDATAKDLAGRYRLHRVTLAGFAGTRAPEAPAAEGAVVAPFVEALSVYIEANGLKAPAVIGHSLGGEAALMLAARHPAQVGRVLVVDALPFYTLLMNPAATVESAKPQAAAMRDGLLRQAPEQARPMQEAVIARMAKTEAARPALVEDGLASDRKVVAAAVYELMTTDLRPELGRIAAPLTVLYAWDPAYGAPAEAFDTLFRGAYAAAPRARLERVDGSFHFIMLDQPQAFRAAVERFLGEAEAKRP
ncbi:alpha/beta hydrolase [Sphingomonas parva]|uniref:Alpha/beta hydrolase n=1 Tax=Sphingomonas parva TaxID=2555898 RepID=A0A4Y8ZRE7_9SPHN|nr:alpha/beta hydrolase [Sphingomonas parva]TFI57695.1 alpha/beta hydrolase [Sphingomonas parva]